jgi:hypothetical protein
MVPLLLVLCGSMAPDAPPAGAVAQFGSRLYRHGQWYHWGSQIALSPDGRWVAVGTHSGRVGMIDLETGQRAFELTPTAPKTQDSPEWMNTVPVLGRQPSCVECVSLQE